MIPNNPDGLEMELRRALRRADPERDFSTLSYSKSPVRWRRWMALAAAIVLMLSIQAGIEYRARRQRGEQAAASLIQALQITHSKLERTRQMVASQLDRRNVL